MITGATAGIGAAFVRRLAADGYDTVLVARNPARLAQIGTEVTGRWGVESESLPADLATEAGCAAAAARLKDPARPIDLLVNNAGISLNRPLLESELAEQERLLRLNVHAVMGLTHGALPAMVARGHGAIVNVSSVAGWAVRPGSTYPASKAWVTSFSESVTSAWK